MANLRLSSKLASLASLSALLACSARGQVAVSRAILGAGGGAAAGGVYAITDTIGESPVGDASEASDAVTGGFWGTFGSIPEISSLSLTVRSNGSLTIATSPLLASDYADGESLSVTSFDVASVAGGAVSLVTGAISYKAPTNFTGLDSFHYTVSDDEGDAATAQVSIDVVASAITVTSAADSGPGTLREAIAAFNSVGAGLIGHIDFAPSLSGQTILLSNVADNSFGPTALVISNSQVIDASGAPGLAVAAAPSAAPMRLMFVPAGSQATVENLVLTNGEALGGNGGAGGGGGGGAAGFGGGILNEGSLTLSNVTLAGNQALGGAGGAGESGPPGAPGAPRYGGFGAGAGASGTCGGDGGLGAGGAIFNYAGVANITNCVLRANSAASGASGAGLGGVCDGASGGPSLGGGIFNYNGYVYLTGCILTNNSAASGGGLCNYGDAAASWVYLAGNTLADPATTNDFASLSANGGDAQTVESTNTIDTQDALWFSSIPNVGTFQTNRPVTVPITLNIPTNISTSFVLQAVASDPSVATNFLFTGGSGGHYMLTITPTVDQLGTFLVTVSTEGSGLSAQTSFRADFGLFLTVTITPGGRILNVTSDPDLTCTIQYKTSLTNAAWATLGNMAQTSPGHYQILDPAAEGAERFYRAVLP